jgi:hypothetical protein
MSRTCDHAVHSTSRRLRCAVGGAPIALSDDFLHEAGAGCTGVDASARLRPHYLASASSRAASASRPAERAKSAAFMSRSLRSLVLAPRASNRSTEASLP